MKKTGNRVFPVDFSPHSNLYCGVSVMPDVRSKGASMIKALRLLAPVMVLGSCLFAADRAYAQAAPVPAEKALTVKNVFGLESNARLRTPIYTVNGGGKIIRSNSSGIREWIQVVAEYYTNPDVKSQWLNQVSFQFYLLTATDNRETKQKEYTVFRGTISYMDVDRKRREARWATLYLRPSGLARYGDPIAVAVEVSVDGRLIDSKSEVDRRYAEKLGTEKEWWKNPKLAVKDGYLLKSSETPFSFINYDDFEEIAQ
jgi:hypothetical protein